MNDEEESVQLKIIMPAALIDEHATVSKVTGEAVFELRNKLPFYSKVEGVSFSVENHSKEPIKFLVASSIDVVSYNTPLRIDYTDWHEGVYTALDLLEKAQKEFEDVNASGVSVMIERLSNYKIALILPLYHIDNGTLVCKESGSQLYTVYKGDQTKKAKRKSSTIKAQINLDDMAFKNFELPENAVFLIRDDKAVLKNIDDFVKIERNIADLDDLISIVSNFIDYIESK